MFVKDFINNTQIQAFSTLIQPLPLEQQTNITTVITKNKEHPEEVAKILESHFPKDQIEQAIGEATEQELTNLLEAIKNNLSDEQKQNVAAVFQGLSSQPISQ